MPATPLILRNVSISVDGTDLSDAASAVTIDTSAEEVEVTTFGGNGWREFEPGLKQGNVEVTFFQDFSASSVHATLWPLSETNEEFELKIGPNTSVPATTNPIFTANVKLFQYNFLQGEVGAASPNPVTFRLTGAPTLDTTP